MDDITDSEKFAFQDEAVRKRIREIIEEKLKDKEYCEASVPHWIDDIQETCIEELFAPRKPFKYVVTCAIMQRTGAAVHSATACYWDPVSDDTISVCWPKRTARDPPSKTILCIVTVFAASFVSGL